MKNKKPDKSSDSGLALSRSISSKKRLKPEPSLSLPLPRTYSQLDDEYVSNGMSPYTVQFLKRMAESSASKFKLPNSDQIHPTQSIYSAIIRMQTITHE